MAKVYEKFATLLTAVNNCIKSGNSEWRDRHTEALSALLRERMPSGSGFDAGTSLDWGKSNSERLVFGADFHHMDSNGFYDGWSYHQVIVTPSLQFGFSLRVTGKDKLEIKDYIADTFHSALSVEV